MKKINNQFYEYYGDRWYSAKDDPVSLLRKEGELKKQWVINLLQKENILKGEILDLGCGGGFLSNELASRGYSVTGIDLSPSSLQTARKFDHTHSVHYLQANAYELPFPDAYFDVLCAMDLLEHVESPTKVIQEAARVLKPYGLLFFHTFNRNFLSWLIAIKFVEWFIKNTPENMHVYELFIPPKDLKNMLKQNQFELKTMTGVRPQFGLPLLRTAWTGIVPDNFSFCLTKNLTLGFMGMAYKKP